MAAPNGLSAPTRLVCLCDSPLDVVFRHGRWTLGHIQEANIRLCLPLVTHADFAVVVRTYQALFAARMDGETWHARRPWDGTEDAWMSLTVPGKEEAYGTYY